MTLSTHVNSEKILASSRELAEQRQKEQGFGVDPHSLFERENRGMHEANARYQTSAMPKYTIPEQGISGEAAYQLINSELDLDGRPNLNLASFVHTWMDPHGVQLMSENMNKNLADTDEYPATTAIHSRCVSMVASLWHADESKNATGTATTGSSEAIMLGGLAMKRQWQHRRKEQGKSIHEPGPNVVMGANAHCAIEKFANYFECEARMVPVDESTSHVMSPERAMDYVDENTIGVYVILGSTYTGHYENVKRLAELLDEYEKKSGHSVSIHVDAASGGFVAPFATPELEWDFRIPRVVSINASGHKYGKAMAGVGWIIWRDAKHLPKDMVLSYLGTKEMSFSLNFSRPAHPILGQYFNFLSLGFEKYRAIILNDLKNARLLARALEQSGYYEVVSACHRPASAQDPKTGVIDKLAKAVNLSSNVDDYVPGLPLVSFKFSDDFRKAYPHIEQKWIQIMLRTKGFIVPNYPLCPNEQDTEILRVVLRERFEEDLVERFVVDLIEITEMLMSNGAPGQQQQHDQQQQETHERRVSKKGLEGHKPKGHSSVC